MKHPINAHMKIRTTLLVVVVALLGGEVTAFADLPDPLATKIYKFDEDAARAVYERLWVAIAMSDMKEANIDPVLVEAYRARESESAEPEIGAWYFDPDHGLLVNELESAPRKLRWIHQGHNSTPEPGAHAMLIWPTIVMLPYKQPLQLKPVHCVPEACYFISNHVDRAKGRRAVNKPGMWLAFRKFDFAMVGDWILAGVLIHKTAPKEPLKHPLFLKWKKELVKRFPAQPLDAE